MIALPRWVQPPRAEGWFADELDHLSEAPRHTELLDGTLTFRPYPQSRWHSRVVHRLTTALEAQAPVGDTVEARMTVRLDSRNRLEPDIVVAMCRFVPGRTWLAAADVMLVVEVVSPQTERRDRTVKPRKYAEAGIPHFWLVERGNHHVPMVHVHKLDASTRTYVPVGVACDVLEQSAPFPVAIELASLDRS